MGHSHHQHRHHGHHHGHGHSHKHDNTYLTSTNKKDPGVRITRIGLYVNFIMAISKAAGGYLLNSQALMADAFHSLTDLVSDFLTLGTVAWSLRPPTEKFPSGYAKIESLGSLGVSSLLLVGGLGMGLHSLETLYHMFFADGIFSAMGVHAHDHTHAHAHSHNHDHSHGSFFGHSHSHNPADMGIPNIHAAWIAAGSIVVKEYLYRATIKIARERKSSILASNAIHHRIDSLTSIVALTAILGSNFLKNVSWLDPVGGLLVSIMVIRAGFANTGAAFLELADVGLDAETKEEIRTASTKALASLRTADITTSAISGSGFKLHSVKGIKAGQSYLIDLEVTVPATLPIGETTIIEETLRQNVGAEVRGARRIRVKFLAQGEDLPADGYDFVKQDTQTGTSGLPEKTVHNEGHIKVDAEDLGTSQVYKRR